MKVKESYNIENQIVISNAWLQLHEALLLLALDKCQSWLALTRSNNKETNTTLSTFFRTAASTAML